MKWWFRLTRRNAMERQLDKELRFHIEEHTSVLIEAGHSPDEARRLARLYLGGPEQVKEECRDARGTRWLEDFAHDLRYAFRVLRQQPGFTVMALLTLALGVGATTMMFTVINGVLLKPFAYRDAAGIFQLQEQTDWSTPKGNIWAFSYPNFLDCRRESKSLELAVWNVNRATVSAPGPAEYVDGLEISANLLPLLGIKVAQGRLFSSAEDHEGAAPVAIISHPMWQSRFGANPSAIGSLLTFDGKAYTVIGVMPAGFRLTDDLYDVFTPIGQDASPRFKNRRLHGVGVWARLRPGATLAQARGELGLIGRTLAQQFPITNQGRTFIADPLRPDPGDAQSTLWLLLGAVSLVLLIACANIASLMLARAVSRERELAVRVALGANRGRLARQCLTESALLALAGGALGVLLAVFGVHPFIALWPGGLPRVQEVAVDWHVTLFALFVSLASGMLFGIAPALRAPARDLEQTLRAGARTVAGSTRGLHRLFVISEIAVAMVLLISAGLLGRTILRLSKLNPGVDTRNVMVARVALSPATLANPDRSRAAWRNVLERARRVPGVRSVTLVDTVPMRQGSNTIPYALNASTQPDDKQPLVLANSITPDYFAVTGIPLRRGRFPTDEDRAGTISVAVIDEVMADQAFPHQDPIGKHIWIGITPDPVMVVGVVGHVRQWGLAADDQSNIRAQLYYPFAQVPDSLVRRWSELMSIAVKTNLDPLSIVEPLRVQVSGASADQVLYDVQTFEQLASASIARQRFLLLLFGVFASLALFLASIGVYGVLAYLTDQRVPEIGVRMALGAGAREVQLLVFRQSLVMILFGIAIGACASVLAARSLVHYVEGVGSIEPLTFAAVVTILVIAGLVASFLPAYRASRTDPMRALRQE